MTLLFNLSLNINIIELNVNSLILLKLTNFGIIKIENCSKNIDFFYLV